MLEICCKTNKSIIFGVFYRPPNSTVEPLTILHEKLSLLSKTSLELVLTGDFNITGVNWRTSLITSYSQLNTYFMDLVLDHFFIQLIDKPTWEENILDLLFTSNADIIETVQIGEPFHSIISDPYIKRPFRKADWCKLNELLSYTPWNCAFMSDDINDNWLAWKDLFYAAVDRCIP